jgi:hypothetical protein
MKYLPLALISLVLILPAGLASSQNAKSDAKAGAAPTAQFSACPKKAADAIQVADKALARGNAHLAAMCLAEVVKDLQARVKALEATKAR